MWKGDQVLAKGALNVGEWHGASVEGHVFAVVLHSLQAILAGLAGTRGGYGDKLPDAETCDAASEVGNDAGNFVAKDHWFLNADRSEATLVVVMKV